MKIITYNVNGIRAALNKGFFTWLKAANPDVLCLQEVKATLDQVDPYLFEQLGYHVYWHSAEKKGYSGVAIFTKIKPDNIEIGCGNDLIDREGRIIRVDLGATSVMSVYMPSGSSGDERQDYKYIFLDFFYDYACKLKSELNGLIISGDYNICHKAIDIHNPKSNANTSGFLPEERAWMDKFVNAGFIDCFRKFNEEPHKYSWWSYRARAREKNLGWRIDYNMASENIKERLKNSVILSDAVHSDHCPVMVELN